MPNTLLACGEGHLLPENPVSSSPISRTAWGRSVPLLGKSSTTQSTLTEGQSSSRHWPNHPFQLADPDLKKAPLKRTLTVHLPAETTMFNPLPCLAYGCEEVKVTLGEAQFTLHRKPSKPDSDFPLSAA